MRITTKTGDLGETSLLFGRRIAKSDKRVCACGAVDELSAALGMARASIQSPLDAKEVILGVQKHLIHLMSQTMVEEEDWPQYLETKPELITAEKIAWLEAAIEEREKRIPPVRGWLVSGESYPASVVNLARTICRRAERCLWSVLEKERPAEAEHLRLGATYLNRLSDLLWFLFQEVK